MMSSQNEIELVTLHVETGINISVLTNLQSALWCEVRERVYYVVDSNVGRSR